MTTTGSTSAAPPPTDLTVPDWAHHGARSGSRSTGSAGPRHPDATYDMQCSSAPTAAGSSGMTATAPVGRLVPGRLDRPDRRRRPGSAGDRKLLGEGGEGDRRGRIGRSTDRLRRRRSSSSTRGAIGSVSGALMMFRPYVTDLPARKDLRSPPTRTRPSVSSGSPPTGSPRSRSPPPSSPSSSTCRPPSSTRTPATRCRTRPRSGKCSTPSSTGSSSAR